MTYLDCTHHHNTQKAEVREFQTEAHPVVTIASWEVFNGQLLLVTTRFHHVAGTFLLLQNSAGHGHVRIS